MNQNVNNNLTNEEKLENFASAALSEAEEISRSILEAIEAEEKNSLEKSEEDVLKMTYELIQSKIGEIRRKKSLDISKANIKAKQDYLVARSELVDKIRAELKTRMLNFVKTEEYAGFLKSKCCEVLKNGTSTYEVFYRPEDEKFIQSLNVSLAGDGIDMAKVKFSPDRSVIIGGLKLRDMRRGIIVNATLDEMLERAGERIGAVIGPYFKN